jgi:hypothetical protein
MGLFKRKPNKEELIKQQNARLNELASSCEVLIQLSKSQEVKDKISKIQDDIRYSIPTINEEALVFDKKIESRLGDLKIAVTCNSATNRINYLCDEINKMIILRNSKSGR